MLWKTLIKRIDEFIIKHPIHPDTRVLRGIAHASKTDISVMLHKLEPRFAVELRGIIPAAFPKKLQRLPLKVSQNIHGKWRVGVTDKERVK